MELLYLYVRDYGILKDASFNFSDKYRFKFDKDKQSLTCDKRGHQLPDKFFSINPTKKDVVTNVSALVGDNGSGKSSVARFLSELFRGEFFHDDRKELSDFILIWKHDLTVYYDTNLTTVDEYKEAIENNLQEKNKKLTFEKSKLNENPENDFRLVYLSNCLQSQGLVDLIAISNDKVTDLSTHYLISNHTQENEYSKTKSSEKNNPERQNKYSDTFSSAIQQFEWQEVDRNLEFLNRAFSDGHDKTLLFPIPRANRVKVNTSDRKNLKRRCAYYKDKAGVEVNNDKDNEQESLESTIGGNKECDTTDAKNRYKILEKLFNKLDLIDGSFVAEFCQAMCYNLIHEFLYSEDGWDKGTSYGYNKLSTWLNKSITSFEDGDSSGLLAIAEDLYGTAKGLSRTIAEQKAVGPMFKFLEDYCSSTNDNSSVLFNIDPMISASSNGLNSAQLKEFRELYKQVQSKTPFVTFNWDPFISAGEQAQLNIFSRLLTLLDDSTDHNKKLVVFFDEIEITIHPELQRQLVSNVIKFFETFFKNYMVQIIFASHSPILLSDIPKSNVNFIKRYNYGNPEFCEVKADGENSYIIVNEKEHRDDTFAANIHTLYTDSFFTKGTMGAFAEGKVREVIEWIKDSEPLNDENYNQAQQVINLIGEPVIAHKLKNMLKNKKSKDHLDKNTEEWIKWHASELEKHKAKLKKLQGQGND